jgi:hypothetical protein
MLAGMSRKLKPSNQVWGLTRSDVEWSSALEAALDDSPARRPRARHNAAYVAGSVGRDCGEHQRVMMAKKRQAVR